MTEPTQHKRTESRCEHCGTIRIEFDPPLQLELDDEILRDETWAVYRQTRLIDGEFFMYVDSLFYTESSARQELQRQIDEYAIVASSDGHWLDPHVYLFDADAELLSMGKVSIRL